MKLSVGLFASAVVAKGMVLQSAACKIIIQRFQLGSGLDLALSQIFDQEWARFSARFWAKLRVGFVNYHIWAILRLSFDFIQDPTKFWARFHIGFCQGFAVVENHKKAVKAVSTVVSKLEMDQKVIDFSSTSQCA